jgi:hypothetical protein
MLDQINDQKDTANNQSLAESSLSPSIDLTLKFHQILVGLLNTPFQRNLQAITHVLGGRFGDYDVAKESILRLARVHPLYGMGNSANTPLHSCKLATTLLRMLTSTYDINSLKQSANCLARSAGAFVGMEYASPNTGLLSAEINTVLQHPSQLFLISVALSDLHAHRFPFSDKSFAHSFCMLVFHLEGKLYGRIYQAFGPPNIGYSLTECIDRGSGSKLLLEKDILDFVNGYERFECYTKWSSKVQNDYQRMFSCSLKLPMQYPLLCHTKVHTCKVDLVTVSKIALLFSS